MVSIALLSTILLVNGGTLPTSLSVSLGEVIDPLRFQSEDPTLIQQLDDIDTHVLGQTVLALDYLGESYEVDVNVTNEGAVVEPLLGDHPFISSFAVNDTHAFVTLFNPSPSDLNLSAYAFLFNDQTLSLDENAVLPSFTTYPLTLEAILTSLDEPLTSIRFQSLEDDSIVDTIVLAPELATQYGSKHLNDYVLIRSNKVVHPEATWNPSSWRALPNDASLPIHELFTPVLTPLDQAKAWATDVMFGRGMFAAGRVEEAFRTLEEEYGFMNPLSQVLLFEQTNTQISGINERGNQDTSTLREAVGRYNYLAARVQGATGLINPNPEPFPWVTLILVSLAVLGLFGAVTYFKSRPIVITKK